MKVAVKIALFVLSISASVAWGQSPITSLALGPDQIGQVKAAVGISTRISFPEPVQEIICGDLYDPGSGKGTFVVQRSGTDQRPGNDVFLKPVASKGMSNMFVRTGEGGEHVYNFDLEIVPTSQAQRVVNITYTPKSRSKEGEDSSMAQPNGENPGDLEQRKTQVLEAARRQADDIVRNARQQADRIAAEAEAKVAETERQSTERLQQERFRSFMRAYMLGVRETKIKNSRVAVNKVVLALDPKIFTFDDKAFVRYTIQNGGDQPFSFVSLSLETTYGDETRPVTSESVQTKTENKLDPGESLTGVIAYDPKQIGAKDKLALVMRGEEKAEILRVNIQ